GGHRRLGRAKKIRRHGRHRQHRLAGRSSQQGISHLDPDHARDARASGREIRGARARRGQGEGQGEGGRGLRSPARSKRASARVGGDMKAKLAAAILFLSLTMTLLAAARAEDAVGLITELKLNRGDVQIRLPGKNWQKPAPLQSVYAGTQI